MHQRQIYRWGVTPTILAKALEKLALVVETRFHGNICNRPLFSKLDLGMIDP
ncbi:hypothetical protein ABER61_20410 [Brevibacillus formosus]|uniref:hypothetical protein n=1 Tax=Brevibacillus formosus TaxID=54913 RepID=UPI00147735BA|nr:hypothetical protein [Brevibacillus formosus]